MIFVDPEALLLAVDSLRAALAEAGLELQMAKSVVMLGAEDVQEEMYKVLAERGLRTTREPIEILCSDLHDADTALLTREPEVGLPAATLKILKGAHDAIAMLQMLLRSEMDKPPQATVLGYFAVVH